MNFKYFHVNTIIKTKNVLEGNEQESIQRLDGSKRFSENIWCPSVNVRVHDVLVHPLDAFIGISFPFSCCPCLFAEARPCNPSAGRNGAQMM